jgi:phage protein D
MEELIKPNHTKNDVASYNILINGKDVDTTYKMISLSILREVNNVPVAKIVFAHKHESKRSSNISNKNDFIPGNKIRINLGPDSINKQVFKGIIVKHAIKVKANDHSQLLIDCMDECVKMTLGRHSRYFEKVKDNRVFDELVSKYKLKTDAEKTKLLHKELVQNHISDWDFLLLRAEANGMQVIPNDGTVKIARPDIQAKEVLIVKGGSSVLEFESEIDTWNQFKNVHRSWLFKTHGRAKFIGYEDIKPGDIVKITGMSDRFNGKVYVTAVRQEMRNGTWETQIHFGLDPERHIPIQAKDAYDEKGFTTKCKMHLSFNCKTNTIKIDTPAGNSITLDEKEKNIIIVDQNKNKITMKPSGISLESKNIDIKAEAVLTLSGGTSLSIIAPSVSVKADADVSITGATAKLAAQGPTEITGLPVKIN